MEKRESQFIHIGPQQITEKGVKTNELTFRYYQETGDHTGFIALRALATLRIAQYQNNNDQLPDDIIPNLSIAVVRQKINNEFRRVRSSLDEKQKELGMEDDLRVSFTLTECALLIEALKCFKESTAGQLRNTSDVSAAADRLDHAVIAQSMARTLENEFPGLTHAPKEDEPVGFGRVLKESGEVILFPAAQEA